MPKKPFTPNFETHKEELSKEELNKLNSSGGIGTLGEEFRNDQPDISWEAEQLAKSQGIYLEFNRARTGSEKEWLYMIRISNPGGGPISREQWLAYDELSDKYTTNPEGHPSIRLTTRQNIQYHWLKKNAVIDVVKSLAEKGMNSLNGCGDNTRNVMACPLSKYSDIFNACDWAHKAGDYFQLPVDPFIKIFAIDPNYVRTPEESFQYGPNLLNRKFKIGFSTYHRDAEGKFVPDNCIEVLTNDMGVVPMIENDKVAAFQIYVGGGQGERNGKPTLASLAQPLTIVSEDQLLQTMDAVLQVHQKWGDRQNRHWARLKYVIKKHGTDWYRDQVSSVLGRSLQKPNPDLDYGNRHLHFGWTYQPSNGHWTYGVYIENGRLIDNSPNGKLKAMVKETMQKYPIEMMITANQDVLFTNIPENAKAEFEDHLKSFGYGERNGKPYSILRKHSGACVGRDTCRLTYTESEKYEPVLIDELEKLGWGDLAESIGITGCERQCFRPSTKTIGLIGTGLNRYQFRLFGDETGKYQGTSLIGKEDIQYLRSVPRENVTTVIDELFKYYKENSQKGESLGEFNRRLGPDTLIDFFKTNPTTAPLMEKPFNTDCVIEL